MIAGDRFLDSVSRRADYADHAEVVQILLELDVALLGVVGQRADADQVHVGEDVVEEVRVGQSRVKGYAGQARFDQALQALVAVGLVQ